MKNVVTPLAESILTVSATDSAIQKKVFGSCITALTISKRNGRYREDIMKIVKLFEESALLIKGVRETIKNEANEQKSGFHGMLMGTVAACMLENMSAGKLKIPWWGIIRTGERVMRADEGIARAVQDF